MKLSKSKLALAKVINENGGWVDDSANWAVQPKHENGNIMFSTGENKPYRGHSCDWFTFDGSGSWLDCSVHYNKVLPNWHQCVLRREEYYQAYPEVTEQDVVDLAKSIDMIDACDNPKADADGWIEWKGGECPVERGTLVDVKYSGGEESFGVSALTEGWHDDHVRGSNGKRTAANWVDTLPVSGIIAYRLHKPEVKPEFCESVTRSITEPEVKPTIEQLAQDYRDAKDYADRKQQEADDAKAAADAALGELERAGEALGLLIAIAKQDREPELVITDWRDLRVNDVIFVGEYDEHESGDYVVIELEDRDYVGSYAVKAAGIDGNGRWIDTAMEWRFIRRP